ncbi:MAG: hypothetical protein JHC26_06210 [Thermofilum sp.]|jgi:hypothetical protein|uniref:hypothetical protein n=1 Tax=Thermofilum sp. TaxID=1961369 RepID=UPI00258D49B4|nr:hypothetical protein [Thermofilum sp.]MCI4408665.1 hypothetical protein [Thermofilum sp.]
MNTNIDFRDKIQDAVNEILEKPRKKSEFAELFRQKTGYRIVFDENPIVLKEKQCNNGTRITGFFLHKLVKKRKTYYMETEAEIFIPTVQREGEPVFYWMNIYDINSRHEYILLSDP